MHFTSIAAVALIAAIMLTSVSGCSMEVSLDPGMTTVDLCTGQECLIDTQCESIFCNGAPTDAQLEQHVQDVINNITSPLPYGVCAAASLPLPTYVIALIIAGSILAVILIVVGVVMIRKRRQKNLETQLNHYQQPIMN